MRTSTTDPTAGQTARAIALDPKASPPIVDPTDPRYGGASAHGRATAGELPRIVDPTDPACGDLAG
jgi:hypothetical protein